MNTTESLKEAVHIPKTATPKPQHDYRHLLRPIQKMLASNRQGTGRVCLWSCPQQFGQCASD
jgi:hypothetical protein